ncbi:unnamed protein product [Ectocarpus sp. CCAP 1310/34]|nr:unnamed protein product [Ectocarpus sp. CCAP 1310/34]
MFVLQLCTFHNDKHGTSLTPESFNSYYFHEVWGGTRAEADAKMVEFFKSPYFLDGIPPLAGAAEVLRKHSRSLNFYLVTSRQDSLQAHTKRWIDAHYPGIFAGLRFGNHFSTEGAVRSKPDLCRMIGAEMIIDDNTTYATECASAGIRSLLFAPHMPSSEPSKPLGSHEGAKSCSQVLLAFLQVNTSRNLVSAAAAAVLLY